MRPVAILQHDKTQRPGFLASYLNQLEVPTRVFLPEDGDSIPFSPQDFSGIVLLGSNRSVNEGLAWMDAESKLIQRAMHADVPVLGHCFGAQMMAKSLGAQVYRNACPNIGWSRLQVAPCGRRLFQTTQVVGFNWHYETFAIPAGAHRLLFGSHCLNKAFSIGKHLAFQCHFEVTEDIIRDWCQEAEGELANVSGPAVQSRATIVSELHRQLPELQRTAQAIYRHWAASLSRPVCARLS